MGGQILASSIIPDSFSTLTRSCLRKLHVNVSGRENLSEFRSLSWLIVVNERSSTIGAPSLVTAVFLGSLKAQRFLQARSEGRSVGGEATAVQIRIN